MEIIIKATPEEASRYAFEKIREEMERRSEGARVGNRQHAGEAVPDHAGK
jgi:hypothetical protein